MSNRNAFLTALEAGKSKVNMNDSRVGVWWEPTSDFIDGYLLILHGRRGGGFLS
jgi:hypothetical protein